MSQQEVTVLPFDQENTNSTDQDQTTSISPSHPLPNITLHNPFLFDPQQPSKIKYDTTTIKNGIRNLVNTFRIYCKNSIKQNQIIDILSGRNITNDLTLHQRRDPKEQVSKHLAILLQQVDKVIPPKMFFNNYFISKAYKTKVLRDVLVYWLINMGEVCMRNLTNVKKSMMQLYLLLIPIITLCLKTNSSVSVYKLVKARAALIGEEVGKCQGRWDEDDGKNTAQVNDKQETEEEEQKGQQDPSEKPDQKKDDKPKQKAPHKAGQKKIVKQEPTDQVSQNSQVWECRIEQIEPKQTIPPAETIPDQYDISCFLDFEQTIEEIGMFGVRLSSDPFNCFDRLRWDQPCNQKEETE